MTESSEVVFIGGRSGVGKSCVGLQIHQQLSPAAVRHCLIEGDYLDMGYPTPWKHGLAERLTNRAILVTNLAAMWANYRDLGYRRLICTNTASVLPEVTEQLTAAMGDSPRVLAVLLTCTEDTARQRLSQREIGPAFKDHLERSAAAASLLESEAPSQVHRISTDGRSVPDIAAEVIDITGRLQS